MDKLEFFGDMPPQRFIKEGYEYLGKDGEWHVKDEAPEWAKEEFKKFHEMVNPVPDEEGRMIQG